MSGKFVGEGAPPCRHRSSSIPSLGQQFIKYARLVAGRGYVHNTLGNMVMRAAHPDFAHGLAYTKHAEISLEEMELENIVITDVPTSRIVWGDH